MESYSSENMISLTESGALILPAVPSRGIPTIEELIDTVVDRILIMPGL